MTSFRLCERRGYRAFPQKAGLYRIRNLNTGARYIGQTQDLRARARSHVSRAHSGSTRVQRRLMEWIQSDSLDAFLVEVIALLERPKLRTMFERTLIAMCDPDLRVNYCRHFSTIVERNRFMKQHGMQPYTLS